MTFRFSASDPDATDIGPLYDVGLSTRDGSSLSCLDRNLKPVLVDRVAYMLARDQQKTMKESTELQQKDRLVQLGTATAIDREFDQWVQNTQGDWSGGAGQRVYGQQGLTNEYFDGEGLIWPLNDYLPQKAMPGPALGLPANFSAFTINEVAGGFVAGAGQGYAYICQHVDTNFYVHFRTGDTELNVQIGTPASFANQLHLSVSCGFIWVLVDTYPTTAAMRLVQVGMVGAALNVIRTDQLGAAANYGAGAAKGLVRASFVANKLYVAVATQSMDSATVTTWKNELYVLDYTTPGAPPLGLATPIDFSSSAGAAAGPALRFTDLAWQGDALFVAISDGFATSIVQVASFGAPTLTTTAILSGIANAFMTSVGASLFLVGVTFGASQQVNRMDLFTLTGGNLTEFGNIFTPAPILDSVSSPVAFGGYALWAVSYTKPGAATKTITVYAFDVVRSRLFRALSFTAAGWTGSDVFSHNEIAVFGTTTRTLQAGVTFNAQWGIAMFSGLISNSLETAREFYWGVVPLTPAPAFAGLLQTGVDIVSGIVDFTASSKKLFRQLVASFFGGLVPGQAVPSVALSVWLDQDPARLAAVPDFTTSTGTPSSPAPSSLNLALNRVARKVVSEVVTTGGLLSSAGAGAIAASTLGASSSSGGANSLVLSAPANAGDLVVLVIACGITQVDTTSVVTDSKGNVWTTDRVMWNAFGGGGLIAHCVLATALAAADVLTFQGKFAGVAVNNQFINLSAIRVTGMGSAVRADAGSGAIGNSATPASGAVAISLVPEIVIGALGSLAVNDMTPDAGWTAIGRTFDTIDLHPVYQVFAAPGNPNASGVFVAGNQWAALEVSFTATAWQNAPKLVDVIVQAATGWVWDAVFDLAPGAKMNIGSPSNGAYANQTPTDAGAADSIDQVVAYNFLRQLWRQKGGECTIYLPNGDTYPALIQLLGFESPKPFAVSGRGDQQSQWQEWVTIKIREDI